jgi:hypothetical protein
MSYLGDLDEFVPRFPLDQEDQDDLDGYRSPAWIDELIAVTKDEDFDGARALDLLQRPFVLDYGNKKTGLERRVKTTNTIPFSASTSSALSAERGDRSADPDICSITSQYLSDSGRRRIVPSTRGVQSST